MRIVVNVQPHVPLLEKCLSVHLAILISFDQTRKPNGRSKTRTSNVDPDILQLSLGASQKRLQISRRNPTLNPGLYPHLHITTQTYIAHIYPCRSLRKLIDSKTFRYEFWSKLLVSPLITPIVVPYIIPYITLFKKFRLQLICSLQLANNRRIR